jgi:hypothetical protein
MICINLAKAEECWFQSEFTELDGTPSVIAPTPATLGIPTPVSVATSSEITSPTSPTKVEFPDIGSPTIPKKLSELSTAWKYLMDSLIVFLDPELFRVGNDQENSDFRQLLDDSVPDICRMIFRAFDSPLGSKDATDFRIEVGEAGLRLLSALVSTVDLNDGISQLEGFEVTTFEYFVRLLGCRDDRITRQILLTSYDIVRNGIGLDVILNQPSIFLALYRAVTEVRDEDLWYYFHGIVSVCCDWSGVFQAAPFVNLGNPKTSCLIDIFPDSLEISNRSWNFETVIASHGVTGTGKYAYEFQLGTTGIIQLGWCCDESSFNERGGYGVGDDLDSYALDGTRVRKWHGRDVGNESYGAKWSVQDVVTVMLDLDERTVSFMLNGSNFGIAFDDVDTSKMWYPAVSCTSHQYGRFFFGGILDKLRFCPEDYVPIPCENESELFYSCHSLQPSESVGSMSFASLNPVDDQDVTPTIQVATNHDTITSIAFFYEISIQIHRNPILVPQFGFVTSTKVVVFAAYHSDSQQLFFISTDYNIQEESLFGGYLYQILEQQQFGILPWSDDEKRLKIFARCRCALDNGSVIGAGINSEEGFCFFSHNGIVLGPRIVLHDFEALPYFRNIPRTIFNFGKTDYKTQVANTCFSPSIIVMK